MYIKPTFELLNHEWVDCSHRPEIPRLMTPILSDGFDVTLGSRVFDLGSPLRVRFSHLGNLIFSFLISLFSRERFSDSHVVFVLLGVI